MAGTSRRALGVALAGAAVLFLAAMLRPGVAEAHAFLQSSDPADGAQVDVPPETVTLSFTEPPDPSLSTIRVVGEGGAEVQTGVPERASRSDLRIALRPMEEGVYSITWRVVSEVDGHPSAGVLSFGVGVPAAAAAEAPRVETPPTSRMEIVARALLFLGLGALIGAAATGTVAFARPPGVTVALATGGGIAGAVGIALLAAAQRSAAGVGFGDLLGTPIGRALVARAIPATVALIAAALAGTARRWTRPALAVAGIAAAASLFAHVAAGHAAADGVGPQVIGQWAHVAAASLWLGGLAALVTALRGEPREEKTRAARRFSSAAGVALLVVLGTGVVRSVDEVGSWSALVSTGYGRLVLAKGALILALAGLGAVNRYRHVPALGRSTGALRRIGGIELGLAAVAVAAAAGLASLVPPASVPAVAERPAAVEVRGSDFARSLRAELGVDPGLPGPNRFSLRLEDFDSSEPAGADAVTLRFRPLGRADVGETSLPLRGGEDGSYEASGPNLSAGGPWDVVAVVQRGADSVEIEFELATACATQTVEGEGDEPTIHLFASPSGGTTEGYLIPLGGGGRTEVHFTFIDDQGSEARVADLSMTAWRPGAGVQTLDPIPLTDGHFFADARLDPGEWRFDAVAELADGSTASGCFEA